MQGVESSRINRMFTLESKEEEIDFLKRKLQETHASWENAKKSENETKDHNILLQSQVRLCMIMESFLMLFITGWFLFIKCAMLY